MIEMNPVLPPELNHALNSYYAAQNPAPAFAARLGQQLRQRQTDLLLLKKKPEIKRLDTRRTFMHTLRTRPLLAVAVAILALLVLTGIVYAVAQLAGFIPGIGFVKDVRSVLQTPVAIERQVTPTAANESIIVAAPTDSTSAVTSQKRGVITVTIEQAVSETDRLVIAYKISGLPANYFGPEHTQKLLNDIQEEPAPEQVRLPDNTILKYLSGGGCEGAGDLATSWMSCQSIFAPLPKGVNEFTLEIQRLQDALPGELPEDWRIPIHLTQVADSGVPGGLQEPDLNSQTIGGITLHLLKVSQGPAQTAFQLGMEWEGQNRFVHHTAPFTLQDQRGRYYILSGGPDSGSYSNNTPNYSTLPSLVTVPIATSRPLTFRLDWVVMSVGGGGKLQFDPGKNAKLGQEWGLDEKVSVGGFDLHFIKARLKESPLGPITLEFDLEAPQDVTEVLLLTDAESISSESGYDHERGVLVSRVTLPSLPLQPVELTISEVLYKVTGPWQITWQPQQTDFSMVPSPTPAPTRMAVLAPTPLPDDQPLLADLQALLGRADAKYPSGPGWVHQEEEITQTPLTGELDSGDLPEQPLQMRVDAWYHLDEDGYIQTSIYLRKTLDGKFISADINNGVYHFSLPEGRGGVDGEVYLEKPSYNSNLLSTLNGYISEGGTIRRENSVLNGVPCQLYEATLPYDPPQVFVGEAAPVQAMVYTACVDPVNGEVLQIQSWMKYTNGKLSSKDMTEFSPPEKVAVLSDEAQQILDKIIMP